VLTFLLILLFAGSLLISVSSLDDAFIDLVAIGIVRHSVPTLSDGDTTIPLTAVFVANWDEEHVLGKMVEGNLARIPLPQVWLYLGVYPNDLGTLRVARELEARYPDRVRVIVNRLAGPTSKGQMLNEMFSEAFSGGGGPELVVLHDSEDVIDPRTFQVYATYAEDHDFIQVPVFSLNRGRLAIIASTYMDDFAERHTREMVVRNAVGAAIPSAGVGTCMSKRLIQYLLETRGQVFMSGTVTEDYILGIEAKRSGFRSAFAVISKNAQTGFDFIATRAYFPKTLEASIKQKTRWVYGINFEALHKLGWQGDPWDVYFFMRDRKGMITSFLPPVSLALLCLMLSGYVDLADLSEPMGMILVASMWINLFAFLARYVVRVLAGAQVYGTRDWIGIALRWPAGLYINMAAVYRAWKIYLGESELASKPIAWSKTSHEIPDDFAAANR
jgi:adsorption protein B